MRVRDLGQMLYRDAWAVQEDAHARVLAGEAEELLFVEHPPVITYGRRDGCEKNLLATEAQLKSMGVDLVKSDRGGDITLHAPGQIVCYPIVRLADHHLSVGGYVHTLERIVIETLGGFGAARGHGPKGRRGLGERCGAAGEDLRHRRPNPQGRFAARARPERLDRPRSV